MREVPRDNTARYRTSRCVEQARIYRRERDARKSRIVGKRDLPQGIDMDYSSLSPPVVRKNMPLDHPFLAPGAKDRCPRIAPTQG
jgi:hypothetical protein